MTTLLLGLVIFFGIHLLPVYPNVRGRLLERFGENGYKGIFALIAMLGLILIVIGMGRRQVVPVWEPPVFLDHLAIVVMLPVFIFLAATYIPCNMKRFTRHPMLWGVTFWASAHLLANGDLGSIILFGSFLAYSLFDMWSANRRGAEKSITVRPVIYDALVAAIGIIAYVIFFLLHPYMFGVSII